MNINKRKVFHNSLRWFATNINLGFFLVDRSIVEGNPTYGGLPPGNYQQFLVWREGWVVIHTGSFHSHIKRPRLHHFLVVTVMEPCANMKFMGEIWVCPEMRNSGMPKIVVSCWTCLQSIVFLGYPVLRQTRMDMSSHPWNSMVNFKIVGKCIFIFFIPRNQW